MEHAAEHVKQDHATLCSTMDMVERSLRLWPAVKPLLRQMCLMLARQLRDHIEQEETLVVICRPTSNPRVLTEFSAQHREAVALLAEVNRRFASEEIRTLDDVKPILGQLIATLRRHLVEEESDLFQLSEWMLWTERGINEKGEDPCLVASNGP